MPGPDPHHVADYLQTILANGGRVRGSSAARILTRLWYSAQRVPSQARTSAPSGEGRLRLGEILASDRKLS